MHYKIDYLYHDSVVFIFFFALMSDVIVLGKSTVIKLDKKNIK